MAAAWAADSRLSARVEAAGMIKASLRPKRLMTDRSRAMRRALSWRRLNWMSPVCRARAKSAMTLPLLTPKSWAMACWV